MQEMSEMSVKFSFSVPKGLPPQHREEILRKLEVFYRMMGAAVLDVLEKAGYQSNTNDVEPSGERPLN